MKSILYIGLAILALFYAGSVFARSSDRKIDAKTANKMLGDDSSIILLDTRTEGEYASGYIPNAILLPYDRIDEVSAAKVIPSKTTTVIVYCRSGRRSAIAVNTLASLGYTNVYDLGGINSWPFDIVR
ncbi:MAG: rhodanese-like domain-containing protein [Spirochaetales bacterium]|nr:rhodanese-like domain-containing protein [Spirochaetales bacterium]